MIKINVEKAKEIAHEVRRQKRAQEFAPLDVKATIPSQAELAEQERQAIREKYAVLQEAINLAQTPEELKTLIS